LRISGEEPQREAETSNEERILAHVRAHGSISNAECCELLKVDGTRAYYLLKKLSQAGRLQGRGRGRWRRYVQK